MAENEKLEQTGKAASDKAEKAKKDKKSDKKSKPGFFARIGRWFRELKVELKKVVWPSKQDVKTNTNTLIVIACVVFVGVFIWIFDAVAGGLIQALIHLVAG